MLALLAGPNWPIIGFAVVAVVLLAVGVFRLDEVITRRKKPAESGERVSNRRFHHADNVLTDPDGRPSTKIRARRGINRT